MRRIVVLALLFGLFACGGDKSTKPSGGDPLPGDPGATTGDTMTGDPGHDGDSVSSLHSDLPADPIVEAGLPANIAELFAPAGSDSGGPCLAEPALDAMVPRNWTPLYFEWVPAAGQNVFELRLSVDNQQSDLVVYSTALDFTMAVSTWSSLAEHSAGHDVAVTLRGAILDGTTLTAGPNLGAEGSVHIAPVDAPGSIVYWSDSSLEGLAVGTSSPVTVLTPASAGTSSTGGATTCVSCHVASPDNELVVYTRDTDDGTRAIDVRKADGTGAPDASAITAEALALLGRDGQAAPVLSAAHFASGNAIAISVFNDPTLTGGRSELVWTDLEAVGGNAWGVMARAGDARPAASPSWRHDGATIAYVSADTVISGVISQGAMDLYTVPYNDTAGGNATPVPGASEPAFEEYYPAYSSNDVWLAFNRHDQTAQNSYSQPSAEIFVVASEGGTPTRLRANDPPACTGLSSPGVTNSWPRWAPAVGEGGALRYYWLAFSSKRRAPEGAPSDPPIQQLYIAAMVTNDAAGLETIVDHYGAVYMRSQDGDAVNYAPAWDEIDVE